MIIALYVGRALLRGFLITLLVLVLLLSLAAFVSELDDVGENLYSVIDALTVVALRIPERARDLAPVSALIGGIVGLSGLARGLEIVSMRALGLSPARVALFALLLALPLASLIFHLGEQFASPLSQDALRRKQVLTRGPDATVTDEALWLREKDAFIRIGGVRDGDTLTDVEVFRLSSGGRLQSVLHAERADLLPRGRWRLSVVEVHTLGEATPVKSAVVVEESPLKERALEMLVTPIGLLPTRRLWQDLHAALPAADRDGIERLFWKRLGAPLQLIAMLLLAIPFAIGSAAAGGLARRLGIGTVTGVMAHIGIEVLSYLSALLDLDARLAAFLPAGILLCAAVVLLARIR